MLTVNSHSLVGVFTYANFYLARPPFRLGTAGLGSIFFVYLFGCLVTPLSGRFLDRYGFSRTAWLSFGFCLTGLGLTLRPSLPAVLAGLAFYSTGLFVMQGAATVLTGVVAGRARSAAAGLYVTCSYLGGSVGTALPAWFWGWGGWPACVALFAATSVLMLSLGLAGSGSLPGRQPGRAAPS